MLRYDLTDIGYTTTGPSKPKTTTQIIDGWKIIDIPFDISESKVKSDVSKFINNISAIELPTSLQCNLRCEYCYITDPSYKSIKINNEQLYKIVKLLPTSFPKYRINSNDELYISPWGAEPFMNMDSLSEIFNIIKSFNYSNIKMHTSTNATILTNKSKQFIEN